MRRFLLAGIASVPLFLIHPGQSGAVIVECANCADEPSALEQIANQVKDLAQQAQAYGQQLLDYQQQVQSYILQGQQYANMVTNTIALPTSVFSQVMGDINQVRNLANAASLLTGNSGSILTRLQSAEGYASQASMLPQNIGQQFSMWQQTFGNASNSLGRVLGVQQGQEVTYAALQQQIQAHSQSAQGQMQAIQAGVEASSLISTQLNQVQATLTAAAQEQATRDMVSADRTAAEDAATVRFFTPAPALPTSGYGTYGSGNFP